MSKKTDIQILLESVARKSSEIYRAVTASRMVLSEKTLVHYNEKNQARPERQVIKLELGRTRDDSLALRVTIVTPHGIRDSAVFYIDDEADPHRADEFKLSNEEAAALASNIDTYLRAMFD